mgnify:CR=1 FL=1
MEGTGDSVALHLRLFEFCFVPDTGTLIESRRGGMDQQFV